MVSNSSISHSQYTDGSIYGPNTGIGLQNGQMLVNSSSVTSSSISANIIIGDQSTTKNKLYIVEPWQSRNPINIESSLWVSLAEDMYSDKEIKQMILNKISDLHPDMYIKFGMNGDAIKLAKRSVTIEFNMG